MHRVPLTSPFVDLLADLGNERWEEFFVGAFAQRFVRREPAVVGDEGLVRRAGESWVERHWRSISLRGLTAASWSYHNPG